MVGVAVAPAVDVAVAVTSVCAFTPRSIRRRSGQFGNISGSVFTTLGTAVPNPDTLKQLSVVRPFVVIGERCPALVNMQTKVATALPTSAIAKRPSPGALTVAALQLGACASAVVGEAPKPKIAVAAVAMIAAAATAAAPSRTTAGLVCIFMTLSRSSFIS